VPHTYWNDWYFGGLVSLVRRYIFTVFEPRKLGLYLPGASEIRCAPRKEAFDVLDTRYAKARSRCWSITR